MIICLSGMLLGQTACMSQSAVTPKESEIATTEAPTETKPADNRHHVIMMSDLHLCHLSWNGHSSEYRMDKMVEDLNQYYEQQPYSNILFMGDYSLDFWQHNEKGSYITKGVSNTKNLIRK